MFIPNDQIIGQKVKLLMDIKVAKGTFKKGSIMTITDYNEARGYDLIDDESGEKLIKISHSNGNNTDNFIFVKYLQRSVDRERFAWKQNNPNDQMAVLCSAIIGNLNNIEPGNVVKPQMGTIQYLMLQLQVLNKHWQFDPFNWSLEKLENKNGK